MGCSQSKQIKVHTVSPKAIKETILPLQKKKFDIVKDPVKEFQIKVLDYRQEFLENTPSGKTETSPKVIDAAYAKIDEYYVKNCEMERQAKELQIFDQKELNDCKNELVLLKEMWDLISNIDGQLESVKDLLWD